MAKQPRRRDHRATYQRRNELARERGFKNYAEQRKAQEYAKGNLDYTAYAGSASMRNATERERIRTFWEAFYVNPDDYGPGSAKAKWFVELEGLMSYDEWSQHYPRGVREYHRKAA